MITRQEIKDTLTGYIQYKRVPEHQCRELIVDGILRQIDSRGLHAYMASYCIVNQSDKNDPNKIVRDNHTLCELNNDLRAVLKKHILFKTVEFYDSKDIK